MISKRAPRGCMLYSRHIKMKIEKLFSIESYNGKREAKTALNTFLLAVKQESSFQTRLFWD